MAHNPLFCVVISVVTRFLLRDASPLSLLFLWLKSSFWGFSFYLKFLPSLYFTQLFLSKDFGWFFKMSCYFWFWSPFFVIFTPYLDFLCSFLIILIFFIFFIHLDKVTGEFFYILEWFLGVFYSFLILGLVLIIFNFWEILLSYLLCIFFR